jgi:hypothetical protein
MIAVERVAEAMERIASALESLVPLDESPKLIPPVERPQANYVE